MHDMLSYYNTTNKRQTVKMEFDELFSFWKRHLFERCINLFKWKGLPMPQREIEFFLLSKGFCGFVNHYDDKRKIREYIATTGGMFGVTNYFDTFTGYTFATPLTNGVKKIGKNCVIMNNNQTRLPLIMLIERYAVLLAHADLSLQCVAINSRSMGALGVDNQSQAESVKAYYNALEIGKTLAIVDNVDMESMLSAQGVRQIGTVYPSSTSIKDYYDLTRDLLQSFYNDLGLRMNNEKRERVINAEIDANNEMLLFNIDDMLESRKEACEELKKVFGLDVSVKLNIKSFDIETKETGEDENVE